MTIQDLMASFDDVAKKKFQTFDVTGSLKLLNDSEQSKPEYKYEYIAFSLVEGAGGDLWKSYYGPMITYTNGQTFPSKEDITIDAVKYWYCRISETHNPILKTLYSGLTFDFAEQMGLTIDKKNIYTTYVNSLIECADGDYLECSLDGLLKLKRAFTLSIKNEALLEKIKQAFSKYEDQYFEITKPGIWNVRFQLLLNYSDCFNDKETNDIVGKIECAFEELLSYSPDDKGDKNLNPWLIQDTGTALADYYKKIRLDKVKEILDKIKDSYERSFSKMVPIQIVGNLEVMSKLYRKYGFYKESDDILIEINQKSNTVKDSLSSFSQEYTIPESALIQVLDFIKDGTLDIVFQKFALYFVHDKDKIEEQVKRLSKQTPLYSIIPSHQIDYKGRIKDIIGSVEEDLSGHMIQQLTTNILIQRPVLTYVIEKLKESDVFSEQKIMDYFSQSPLFCIDRCVLIKYGLQAYYKGDYYSCISIWIPQIENAVRELVEQSGGQSIMYNPHRAGYKLKTLDALLLDPIIEKCFDKNFVFYFRVLLTDSRGMNIRNDFCHGLVPSTYYNRSIADRLFHLLIVFGSVSLKK